MFTEYLFLIFLVYSSTTMTNAKVIEGEYVITLNEDVVTSEAKEKEFIAELKKDFNVSLINAIHVGTTRFLHVSADKADIDRVSVLPEVNSVEVNEETEMAQTRLCHERAAPKTWGLDRIDQKLKLASSNPFSKTSKYTVGPYRGAGVVAYIGDTGIDISHPEFGNRAFWGFTAPGRGGNNDVHGHGTHVAGTIGSTSHGVAKEVILIAVKILNDGGFGSKDAMLAGMGWILEHHNSRKSSGSNPRSVVNLSIQGEASDCEDKAVQQLIDAGVTVVAAAGNWNRDACGISPARIKEAITVGATDIKDNPAVFNGVEATNWGSCLDVFAPGFAIMSTFPGNKFGHLSGTSMAAPHVTGVVALKMSKNDATIMPKEMSDWVIAQSTRNQINLSTSNHRESPNRILYMQCLL